MQLNPGLRILHLSPDTVQIGLGEHGVLLAGLPPGAAEFIGMLQRGLDPSDLASAGTACGLEPSVTAELLHGLETVLMPEGTGGPPLAGLRADRLAVDSRTWSAAYARDGGTVLARRGSAVVRILGLSRTGSMISQFLVSAGVGTVLLEDPDTVRAADVAAGAYRLTDVGLPRVEAARRQIRQLDPTAQVQALGQRAAALAVPADLVVCVAADAPDPALTARLLRDGQAHLAVLHRELDALVGPLVIPGMSACLECLEHYRADASPGWQDSYAALQAAAGEAGGAGSGGETALAAAAAGLATLQALLHVDGLHRPGCVDAVLRIVAADGSVTRHRYARHRACGCRLQDAA